MIDWDRVSVLRQEVGEDDFGEVIELFLEEVEGTIARLRQNPAADTLEEELHFLKGSALNLGFRQLASHCQFGEALASQGQSDEIELPEILECYARSKAEFLGELLKALAD
ncbi:MAG: Hpt domain-containing protein [Sulfitobacter sp.]